MALDPSSIEREQKDGLIAELLKWIVENRRIVLGPQGQSPFAGTVASFRYAFEGEDDLLHLWVTRLDDQPFSVEEAQEVVAFVLPNVSPGVVWLKPGIHSHHFYVGHDELLK